MAYSADLEDAAEALGKEGMIVQSRGSGLFVVAADSGAVDRACRMPWVIKIELPAGLDMKSRLRGR